MPPAAGRVSPAADGRGCPAAVGRADPGAVGLVTSIEPAKCVGTSELKTCAFVVGRGKYTPVFLVGLVFGRVGAAVYDGRGDDEDAYASPTSISAWVTWKFCFVL